MTVGGEQASAPRRMPAARGEGGEDGEAVGMESEPAPFDVDAAAVEAALGVAVQQTVGPTGAAVLRFRVAVGIDTGRLRMIFSNSAT